ncbi:uncharacterized protein [Nicotiana sylvestris]|uniref:uncharacterized protein n=1 Tax=Nicotiana sylvestris TaxID=4096 RepID=UPI00388C33E9
MPELPRLEGKGSSISTSSWVISFLKARHMTEKGCSAYLGYVRDTTAESPMIDLVLVVWEFADMFPSDLPGMPPDHDIDFCIDLAPDSLAFLGHAISSEGIKVDPKKIESVQSWPHPTLAIEIRSFLGLADYYRRFMKGFSSITAPLTKLTKKGALFYWSDDCEVSFRRLKTALTTALVLVLPFGSGIWLELLKDYKITIIYHQGKANVVADALSRESIGSLAFILAEERPLALDIQSLANRLVRLDILEPNRVLACVVAQSSLLEQIKARQFVDLHLMVLRETVLQTGAKEVSIGEDGVLRLQGRLCVPNVNVLRGRILEEAHNSRYSIYPGATKMYLT